MPPDLSKPKVWIWCVCTSPQPSSIGMLDNSLLHEEVLSLLVVLLGKGTGMVVEVVCMPREMCKRSCYTDLKNLDGLWIGKV